MPNYYPIDEALARRAKEMISFDAYKPGTQTEAYKSQVDAAAALVERRKTAISPFYFEKLDRLLDSYARRLAQWHNDYNRNTASCPSIFISGAGNFPVRKKERQNAREDRLWQEYEAITAILDKIRAVGTGPVDLSDPHAREILEDQLQRLQSTQQRMKDANAHVRKRGTFAGFRDLTPEAAAKCDAAFADLRECCPYVDKPYPDYELTSIRGKIKRVQDRLAELEKLQAATESPAEDLPFDGGRIVENAELNRLQIIFDEIPDADTRAALKRNGFRWSPSAGAWQRQLTDNAMRAAKTILGIA